MRKRRGSCCATTRPAAWLPKRLDALKKLDETGLKPGRIIWATDGFNNDDSDAFARGLSAKAATEVRVTRPKNAFAITSADSSAEGARVSVVRANSLPGATADVIAETAEGASIASTRISFDGGSMTADALFAIPAAALNRVARFRIGGSPSAGGVWLWDDTARRPHVGLADTRDEAQPLLSEHYYVRKALQPYAQLTEKKLPDLLDSPIDAIVLGDRGTIEEGTRAKLTEWIEKGGVLIRFAGPRLAAQDDRLHTGAAAADFTLAGIVAVVGDAAADCAVRQQLRRSSAFRVPRIQPCASRFWPSPRPSSTA
jgi:hypothetical protein